MPNYSGRYEGRIEGERTERCTAEDIQKEIDQLPGIAAGQVLVAGPWQSERPTNPGWYFMLDNRGRVSPVEIVARDEGIEGSPLILEPTIPTEYGRAIYDKAWDGSLFSGPFFPPPIPPKRRTDESD